MDRPVPKEEDMIKVLKGVRVLDFSRIAAAPLCTALLANMGAEVIRVERPGGEEDRRFPPFTCAGESIAFTCYSHNKKGITLNLQKQGCQDLIRKLVEHSDIVVHNFVSGTREAKLLEYEKLKGIRPGIIIMALTGFGQYGPYAKRVCVDTQAQALSGVMSFNGYPGDPPTRTGIEWVDVMTSVSGALGIMFALFWKEKTGKGQFIDVSLFDNAIYAVANRGIIADYIINKIERTQLGNESWYFFGNSFRAKDGWVMLNPATDSLWRRFAKEIGNEKLLMDERFETPFSRFVNRDIINSIVQPWVAERSVEEIDNTMEKALVPCSPIYTVAQVSSDPHVKARGMITEVKSPQKHPVPVAELPFKLSLSPGKVKGRAPNAGEHNREIYCGLLGLSEKELSQLERNGII